MNVGKRPFYVDQNKKLCLAFAPVLRGSLFTKEEKKIGKITLPKNTYAFKFLGRTLVVYHNSKRRDTFGPHKPQIQDMVLTYANRPKPVNIAGKSIPEPYSHDIRRGQVERIDIYLQ